MQDAEAHASSLSQAAAFHARDADLLCMDVAAAVFPSSSRPPSEQQIAGVSRRMVEILSSLEDRLCGDIGHSGGLWRGLLQSPLCRDRQFIDFLMARYVESQLEQKLHRADPVFLAQSLPTQMLQSENTEMAETAQAVLVASSLSRREAPLRWQYATPELLHRLCWRLAALLFEENGEEDIEPEAAVTAVLAEYDPMQPVAACTAKLLHLMGDAYEDELNRLEIAGVGLFTQFLASRSGLSYDHILRLIGSHSPAPLAILQQKAGLAKETALENISILFGFDLLPRDIMAIEHGYDSLDPASMREAIRQWKEARLNMLSGRSQDGVFAR